MDGLYQFMQWFGSVSMFAAFAAMLYLAVRPGRKDDRKS